MSAKTLETDYLVIGCGAMGMAFADVILTETDASVMLVDKQHRPGGHWNVAYPYVRLHQPSSFYGVNSRALGSDAIDQTGWNKGLYELASSGEVCAYFDQVMQQQFLPTGRAQYYPMCEYQGDAGFTSLVTGQAYQVNVRKKIVDATYMNVTVPVMREPPYDVTDGIRCVALNELASLHAPCSGYVVIGAGKTGMDACLWLLQNQVNPDLITWIMPRDSWLLDRAAIQPDGAPAKQASAESAILPMKTIAAAESIDALFEGLEATGALLRLDPSVRPTMYRCATVTRAELEQLRRIRNVVRKGRVQRITSTEIVLDGGSIPTSAEVLHVDCTADGLARRPVVPVFAENSITLQSVRTCQQVFSAAFIGHVEAALSDEAQKNHLCAPVPHPDDEIDWLKVTLATTLNQIQWTLHPEIIGWLARSRLDLFTRLGESPDPSAPADPDALKKLQEDVTRGVGRLQELIASADAT
jgi:hypothetical protein